MPAGVPFPPDDVDDELPPHPPTAMKAKTITAVDRTGRRRFPTKIRRAVPTASVHPTGPTHGGRIIAGPPLALPAAVVATLTVTEVAELPVILTEAGTLQTGAGVTAGVMLQARFTVPLNEPAGVSARLNVAVCPAEIVDELEPPDPAPKVKSAAAVAVPERLMV